MINFYFWILREFCYYNHEGRDILLFLQVNFPCIFWRGTNACDLTFFWCMYSQIFTLHKFFLLRVTDSFWCLIIPFLICELKLGGCTFTCKDSSIGRGPAEITSRVLSLSATMSPTWKGNISISYRVASFHLPCLILLSIMIYAGFKRPKRSWTANEAEGMVSDTLFLLPVIRWTMYLLILFL